MSKVTHKVKRGDKVTLTKIRPQQHNVWIERSEADVQALRDKDAKEGRWHDEGGEPIIYGPYKGLPFDVESTEVVVTSLRPAWKGMGHRPKGLRSGFSEALGCEVLFQSV